jgi:hypothetical protein
MSDWRTVNCREAHFLTLKLSRCAACNLLSGSSAPNIDLCTDSDSVEEGRTESSTTHEAFLPTSRSFTDFSPLMGHP